VLSRKRKSSLAELEEVVAENELNARPMRRKAQGDPLRGPPSWISGREAERTSRKNVPAAWMEGKLHTGTQFVGEGGGFQS
jgi:hypothetical protein